MGMGKRRPLRMMVVCRIGRRCQVQAPVIGGSVRARKKQSSEEKSRVEADTRGSY